MSVVIECSRCGFVEGIPVDAWDAMGRPLPEQLGWARDGRGGWLCEDNGCAEVERLLRFAREGLGRAS